MNKLYTKDYLDNVLSKVPMGEELIKLYYQLSPVIVKGMEESDLVRAWVKKRIGDILLLIRESLE